MKRIPKLLIVSGSDSSGGAGMQADINMARLCGAYPLSAITCITVQSPLGMTAISPVSPEIFRLQLESALIGGRPDAVKVGMLPSDEHLTILIEFLKVHKLPNVVVDPIFAPTLGEENMPESCWNNPELIREIFPFITLLTPNQPECEKIIEALGHNPDMEAESMLVGREHLNALLLTGGHGESFSDEVIEEALSYRDEECFNVLSTDYTYFDRVETNNTHGTGCNLSTAIAAFLARGEKLQDAVRNGEKILHEMLELNAGIEFCPEHPEMRGPAALINPKTDKYECYDQQSADITSCRSDYIGGSYEVEEDPFGGNRHCDQR